MVEFLLGSLFGVLLTSVICYFKFKDENRNRDIEGIPLYIPSELYWKKTRNSFEEYKSRIKSGFGDLVITLRGYGYERVSDSLDDRDKLSSQKRVWIWSISIGSEMVVRERLNSEDSLMGASEAKDKILQEVLKNLTQ